MFKGITKQDFDDLRVTISQQSFNVQKFLMHPTTWKYFRIMPIIDLYCAILESGYRVGKQIETDTDLIFYLDHPDMESTTITIGKPK